MSKNMRIESGNEYSLSRLFGGKNKIVIPDLQRDYCWGKDAWVKTRETGGGFADLVTGFIDTLLNLYSEQKEQSSGLKIQTLGLIYGYEQPKGHIQICDGQQRLTTLFLLLGYVNTMAGGDFNEYLISEEGRAGDSEPRLQYAIRESTLYFLDDLTREVFADGAGKASLEDVLRAYRSRDKKSHVFPAWYFQEYDLDPSIQNMLAALDRIDCVAKEKSFADWNGFGKYLLQNLQFLYYDMGSRSRGEETYIVINTTGEPLSPAENIKPIVIGNISLEQREKYSKEWEQREEWFWQNRGDQKTSDFYSYRFLVWYWQIGLLQYKRWKNDISFELNPRELFLKAPPSVVTDNAESASSERWGKFHSPETIHSYFLAFQKFVNTVAESEELKKIFSSVSFGLRSPKTFEGTVSDFFDKKTSGHEDWQLNLVLPGIAYLEKFPDAKYFPKFLGRLRKNFFDLRRIRKPSKKDNKKSDSYVDWRHIIQIIEHSKNEEEVFAFDTLGRSNEFKRIPNVYPLDVYITEWYGESERNWECLKKLGIDVVKWSGHRALMGDLTPLVVKNEEGNISLEKTEKRWKNLAFLSACIEEDKSDGLFNPDVANWYRLFRVLSGIIPIGHQPYTSSSVGCHYSYCSDSVQSDFAYVAANSFADLLDADDLLSELQKKCLALLKNEGLLEWSKLPTAENLLKAFLFAKTLINQGTAVDFFDDRPIAADITILNNRINPECPLDWGNVICRYRQRGGWAPIRKSGSEYLDTPLINVDGVEGPPTEAEITKATITISDLIKRLLEDKGMMATTGGRTTESPGGE
ncbi:MAG: DUF262 domain-containing protein [Kiritimatiellae bacterium]|nr:DUF262 domain-containing protein [Kiritimatiellia bacterium]